MHQDTWNIYTSDSDGPRIHPGRGSLLITIPGRLAALHFLRDIATQKIRVKNIRELLWAERDGVRFDQMRVTDYIPVTMYMECSINPALYHYLQQPIPDHYIQYINAHPIDNQPLHKKLTIIRSFQFPIDPFISIQRRSQYIQDMSHDDIPTHLLHHESWSVHLPNQITSDPNIIPEIDGQYIAINPETYPPNNTMRDILTHTIIQNPVLHYSHHERIRILRDLYNHPNIDLDTTIPDQWSHAAP